jgi:hypothetical protein
MLSVTSFERRWARYLCTMTIVLLKLLLFKYFGQFIDGWFQYPRQYRFGYCLITPRIYFLFCIVFILPLALSVICRIFILRSPVKILFCLVPLIVFSFRANLLFYLGTMRRLTWNSINLEIPHSIWRFHVFHHMHTIVWDGSKLYCLLVWILSCAQPGARRRGQ